MVALFIISIYTKSAIPWLMKRIIESLLIKNLDIIAIIGLFALFLVLWSKIVGGA